MTSDCILQSRNDALGEIEVTFYYLLRMRYVQVAFASAKWLIIGKEVSSDRLSLAFRATCLPYNEITGGV